MSALQAKGLVETTRDPNDTRRAMVSLTRSGGNHLPTLERTIDAAGATTRTLVDQIRTDLQDLP